MNAIKKAAEQFRFYEQEHRNKGSEEKAEVNAQHAQRLEKLAQDLDNVHEIAMLDGNAKANHYMRGMANGSEVLMATIENREAQFISEDKVVPQLSDHVCLIGDWAHDRNLVAGSTAQAQTVKLGEEFGELCAGVARHNLNLIEDSIGDMVVVLTLISLQTGLDFATCVEAAYNQIKDRKGRMVDGVFVKDEE